MSREIVNSYEDWEGMVEAGEKIVLCKYADPEEGAREGLSLSEAREIAAEDPGLIYGYRVKECEYVVIHEKENIEDHWVLEVAARFRTRAQAEEERLVYAYPNSFEIVEVDSETDKEVAK